MNTLDPIKKIEYLKDSYISKQKHITSTLNTEIIEAYNIGEDILKELKILRSSRYDTIDYLQQAASRYIFKCNGPLLETWLLQSMHSCPTYVYAYNYLAQKVNKEEHYVFFEVMILSDIELFELLDKEKDKTIKVNSTNNSGERLSVKQIALIAVYKNQTITRENASEIAEKHKYNSKFSGEGLYQDYVFFMSRANRCAIPDPFSLNKLKNKIDLFESVLVYLDEYERRQANDEVKSLNIRLKSELE